MTRGLIEDVIDGYGNAAERLQRAGVAGCEIVANMGYLPVQFLNPRVNRRQDDYGGSFENRLRFLRGVVSDIRLKTRRGSLSVCVFRALALTEQRGLTGARAVDAYLTGFETIARIGEAGAGPNSARSTTASK